jgi:hypothetical protein
MLHSCALIAAAVAYLQSADCYLDSVHAATALVKRSCCCPERTAHSSCVRLLLALTMVASTSMHSNEVGWHGMRSSTVLLL